MTNDLLLQIVRTLVPNAELVIRGFVENSDDYENKVEWFDVRPQPSWADIETARPSVQTAIANRNAQNLRRSAFQAEADPVYFEWQRGETTEQAWRDKCDEIRARYPYQ